MATIKKKWLKIKLWAKAPKIKVWGKLKRKVKAKPPKVWNMLAKKRLKRKTA